MTRRAEHVGHLTDAEETAATTMPDHAHPGPWAPAGRCNAATARHVRIDSDAGEIAIATWAGSEQATDANARLIAAAPRMAAALDRCERALRAHLASTNTPEGRDCLAAMNEARAALAAAGVS